MNRLEKLARGRHRILSGGHRLGDGVDLLHAMRDTDGENQEGHQDGKRIEAITEQGKRAELPDHRSQRTGDNQGGEQQRTAVPIHGQRRQQRGQGEEAGDTPGAVGDVADLLGEADNLHRVLGRFVLAADVFFQPGGEIEVIELPVSVGVLFEQIGDDHDGAVVPGHQTAHVTAAHHALADGGDLVGVERGGGDLAADDVIGLKTVLGQFIGAGIGRPQRLHRTAVDAGQKEHCLGEIVQLLQRGLVPDVSFIGAQHDHDAVGAEQLVAVLEKDIGIFVTDRQLLVEAGRQAQLQRHDGGE